MTPSLSPEDLSPYYNNRKRNSLAWTIPQAAMDPSGSTYDQGGFSPDAPQDNAWPNQTPLDPAAFRVDAVSSAGPGGMGASGQPDSPKASGDISAGAGNVLNGTGKKMPPPGMDDHAAPTDIPPEMRQQAPAAAAAIGPPPAPQKQPPPGTDPDNDPILPQLKAVTDRMASRQAPELKSNWAQRLAMAVLAAGKLAPYAQQIVHPKFTEQNEQYQNAQKSDEAVLGSLGKAENTASLEAQRQGQVDLHEEQAAKAKAQADPHYGRREIDASYAKENLPWIQPEVGVDGTPHYFVDKAVENTLSKPIPASRLINITEGGSLYDPDSGKIVATGTPKTPVVKESETPLGQRVPQINQMLQARYQVLHPGKPLPQQFMMPPNAVQQDFANVDKVLEAEERATGNQAQLQIANEMRRQTSAIAASNHSDSVAAREHKDDLGLKQVASKAYAPVMDSAERFNVMAKNYEDAVKDHNQQAMLSLLANHLGMTMGLQKGARLTKDIINEAAKSQPWIQGVASKFDKDGYLSGLTLSPPQMRQMVDLGRERFREDLAKARGEAKYMGVTDDGPDRTPSRSTINHYVALANGNAAKAKELAAADGWTVK